MLTAVHLRDLLVDPGAHPRGQAHLSSASGLVRVGEWLYAVADDEHHLGRFKADAEPGEPVKLHRILAGDLPVDKGRRKKHKPDLEALALLPAAGLPHGILLALGSGSRPNREQGFIVDLDGQGALTGEARTVDLAGLYQPLRSTFADLNIEGAFVAGDRFVSCSGATRATAGTRPSNTRSRKSRIGLRVRTAHRRPRFAIARVSLGTLAGIPLGFTDGAALPSGGWVFSAVAEDTRDSYRDGACAASAIGWVDANGQLQRVEPIVGAPKVEGVALPAMDPC